MNEFVGKLPGSCLTLTEECEGNIDMVNGIPFTAEKLSTSGLLSMSGWLATSVNKGSLPEAVYVILTDTQGKHLYFKTRRMPRPDVGEYFKNPKLDESGYSIVGDIAALNGPYTLGLAIKQSGKMKICSQFKIPLTLTKVDHYHAEK
jgi:hypothetical protein